MFGNQMNRSSTHF